MNDGRSRISGGGIFSQGSTVRFDWTLVMVVSQSVCVKQGHWVQ